MRIRGLDIIRGVTSSYGLTLGSWLIISTSVELHCAHIYATMVRTGGGEILGILADLPGWKRFKTLVKREKKMLRMVNQAKLRSYNHAP